MFSPVPARGGGTGGRETERKGGGRCTGGGRRGGGKRDSQGGGKREKKSKITQHCAMFRNRKNAKGREPKNTGREPGLKGTGSGRFKPPCPPPPASRLPGLCELRSAGYFFCEVLTCSLGVKKKRVIGLVDSCTRDRILRLFHSFALMSVSSP